MAISFKLYADSDLTNEVGDTLDLTHKNDLSDNPQIFGLYFGSTVVGRKLQTETNPGTDDIVLLPTEILGRWQASTSYSDGDVIRPTSGKENGRKYRSHGSGATGTTEPTWTTDPADTYVDGTVMWVYAGEVHKKDEIKLAAASGRLSSATAGGSLSLGTEILSGKANAKLVWIQVDNAVTEIGTNAGAPNIAVVINAVIETNA